MVKFENTFKISTSDRITFFVDVILQAQESELQALSRLLKSIKDEISHQFGVKPGCLKYNRIVSKTVTPEGILTVVELKAGDIPQGKPVLKFSNSVLSNGQSLENMILYVDIFPYYDDNKAITGDFVADTILQSGVKEEFIDKKAVNEAAAKSRSEETAAYDVEAAKGVNPDVGKDAILDFKIGADPAESSLNKYVSSRRAKKGDVLCIKHPREIGFNPGRNLFGEELEPLYGRDFNLIAGNGTKLSDDGLKILADSDGVAIIRKDETKISSMSASRGFPREVLLRIDPVRLVEATQTVEIVTKESVEVRGSLKSNSSIISEGEVYVTGNVEPKSRIYAQDDILVEGDIAEGSLVSSRNIFSGGDVDGSTLSARGVIRIEGTVRNSTVFGDEVEVDCLVNSTVIAAKRVVVKYIESDETGIMNEIRVGVKEYQKMKTAENDDFLQYLNNDLNKMKTLFGEELVSDLTYANTELMLLKFAKTMSKKRAFSPEQMDASKRLLESIPSLKITINEKTKENTDLKKRMETDEEIPGFIIIREKFLQPVKVQINSAITELAPGEGGVYTVEDGAIVRQDA